MEDILVNSISYQVHKCFPEFPIYIDRQDQNFEVPAFYVYLGATKVNKGLRNRDMYNETINYSFFIIYKNNHDAMEQKDALKVYTALKREFRYLKVKTYEGKDRIFQVNSFDMTFNDILMQITLRFNIPYRFINEAENVKSLDNIIIMKEEE